MSESESMADVDARAAAAATGGDAARARSLAEGGHQPPAVKGGATVSVSVVLLAVLVASVAALLVSSVPRAGDDGVVGEGAVGKAMQGAGAGEAAAGKPAEPVEHAVGDIGAGAGGTPGFNSRLDALRTWARLAWMKLRRPRSDEPRYGEDGGAGSTGSVAGAAKRSFEMGKETVEQAAATAARATGDAVEATKEKVKGAAASPSAGESEL